MAASLSMAILRTAQPDFTVEDVARQMQSNWNYQVDELATEDNTMSFHANGVAVILGTMPAPFPGNELKEICDASLLFPEESEAELASHQSHLICTLAGELKPMDAARLLTHVSCAVAKASDAVIGIIWSAAEMIVRKDIFIDMVESVMPEGPPLMLWVRVVMGPSPTGKGAAGFTKGLEALGHMEFETTNASDDAEGLFDRFLGLSSYVLENGPVINDGDTIGESASEKIRVVYEPSSFGLEGKVMRLDYSSAKKPWWKFW